MITGINEGDTVPINANSSVFYILEDGDAIQVWCEDDDGGFVTAGEQDDDGTYEGLDTTGLSGPGHIRVSRFYRDREMYEDAFDSAILSEGEIVNIVPVVWTN